MSGLLASEFVKDELKRNTQSFLQAMRDHKFDVIYNQLITQDSAQLISATLWPIVFIQNNKIDEFINLSKADELAMSFQMDAENIRSGFFIGFETGLASANWYEFSDTDCLAFVDGTAAILVASTPKTALLMPFALDRDDIYRVDLGALALFSLLIRASAFYRLGTRALELGNHQNAMAMFELVASMSIPYSVLRRLVWDHSVVGQFITDPRKKELEEEAQYTLLARDQVLRGFAVDDNLAQPTINIGRFLANTFQGYNDIPETPISLEEIDRLNLLKDNALRKAIASILIGVDRVSAQREANKPHTGAEISDMELEIELDGRMYQLCMPFKSGVEIKGDKVPVEIAYQIIRPFMFFPKCIVVLITAKPCSQYLHNYIKQATATQGWPIGVIEHEALAKLLRINNLLG